MPNIRLLSFKSHRRHYTTIFTCLVQKMPDDENIFKCKCPRSLWQSCSRVHVIIHRDRTTPRQQSPAMLEHLWLTIAVYCLPCVFLLHWLESHNKLAAKAFSGRWNGQRSPERLLEKARVCQEKSSVLLSLNMESWEDIQLEI